MQDAKYVLQFVYIAVTFRTGSIMAPSLGTSLKEMACKRLRWLPAETRFPFDWRGLLCASSILTAMAFIFVDCGFPPAGMGFYDTSMAGCGLDDGRPGQFSLSMTYWGRHCCMGSNDIFCRGCVIYGLQLT
jgi:hypothetical protein